MTKSEKNDLINVDTKSFELTSFNLIVGVISFNLSGYYFPSEKWYDFPVHLLGWWLNDLLIAIDENLNTIDMTFMDGPFKLRINCRTDETWEVICIERSVEKEMRGYSTEIDAYEFVRCLIKKSGVVVRYCDRLGWENDDVTFLKARYHASQYCRLA